MVLAWPNDFLKRLSSWRGVRWCWVGSRAPKTSLRRWSHSAELSRSLARCSLSTAACREACTEPSPGMICQASPLGGVGEQCWYTPLDTLVRTHEGQFAKPWLLQLPQDEVRQMMQ